MINASKTTICAGEQIILTATGASNYLWSASPSPMSTTLSTFYPSPTANNTYTVTTTNANGCSSSSSVLITVNPKPALPSFSVSPTTICAGGSVVVTFNDPSTAYYNVFNLPSGTSSLNPKFANGYQGGHFEWFNVGTTSGNFTWTFTDNVTGCTNSKSIPITVTTPAISPILGPTSLCQGSTAQYSCATTGGVWSSDAVLKADATGLIKPTSQTNNPVGLYYKLGSTCQATLGVKVDPLPTTGNSFTSPIVISNNIACGFTYSNTQNTNNCFVNNYGQASPEIIYSFTIPATRTIKISTCGSNLADTYLYLLNSSKTIVASNDDNGPVCSGLKASINQVLNAGTYYIISEGYGTNSGPITLDLSVDAASNCSAARIGEIISDETNLVVFPNPAQDQINVNQEGTKVIYSTMGVEVIRTEENTINVSNLASGLYVIQIVNGNTTSKTTFVKQ